jgi:hypothetical protein
MTEELFPEKKRCVKDVSLYVSTVTRRTDDFTLSWSKNECQSLTKFSLALDESTDTCGTAQLLIFVRGIGVEFEITEELAGLQSKKGNHEWGGYFSETVSLKLERTLLCDH